MKKMDGISRTRVKALLANRVVLVDNNIQTQYNFPLKPGMKVQVSREKNKHEFRHPMLKILYEDAYLIVVEKKEGLLSVATDHQKERTAQHILNEYVKRTHRSNRIFVVHRLDRETSGIMMYAKDEKTQHTLRDNWHDIVYDRRYVSIVMGDMEKGQGTVRSWLTDRKLYVSSSPVDDGGKLSITHYRTIKRANGYSLMELQLETGRKNQIRVHMQSLGHPVPLDPHGTVPTVRDRQDAFISYSRLFLRNILKEFLHVTAAKPTRSDVWHSTPSSCASTTRLRANGWNSRLPILPRSRT